MKHYILLLHTSIPRYFAGEFIYSDLVDGTTFVEIEWTKQMSMATPMTYEEVNQLKTWCDQYRSEFTQILDTSLEIIMQP